MWPLEPRSEAVLRLGRERVELWDARAGEPIGAAAIEAAMDCASLEHAIAQVLQTQPVPQRVDVVAESAWAPLLALPAGPWRWNLASQLAGLLRHRLEALYGDAGGPVASWSLRVEYRPGDAAALGYALPPNVKAAIERAMQGSDTTVATLQPAFAWGLATTSRRARTRSGWWVWLEQDRTLVAHLQRGEITALQPAAPVLATSAGLPMLLRIEAMRFGVDDAETAVVGGWQAPDAMPPGISWIPAIARNVVSTSVQPAEAAP